MKWLTRFSIVILSLAVCDACARPPIDLTAEQIQSLALSTTDLSGVYAIDNTYSGVATYQSLIDEGSAQTAEYVKSLESVQIYRRAFEATSSAPGPLVIWNWVLVYQSDLDEKLESLRSFIQS